MTTLLLGLRLSLRPFFPWRPIESGWLSLLFLHLFFKVSFRSLPNALVSVPLAVKRVIVKDETKRRSLQPGTLSDARIRTPSNAHAKTSGPPPTSTVEKETPAPAPQLTADETKQRTLQPRGEDQALIDADALKGKAFTHKFYGSALIVGSRTLMSGLSVGLHQLEITAGGQVFIDNNPYPVNPTDLVRIKAELSKVVR
jgi:hypothetical protein